MTKTTMSFVSEKDGAAISTNGSPTLEGREMTVLRTKDRHYYAEKKYLIYDDETGHLRVGNGPNKKMESVGGVKVVKKNETLPTKGRIDTLYVSLADNVLRVWDEDNYEWVEIFGGGGSVNLDNVPRTKSVSINVPSTGWTTNDNEDYPYKVTIKNIDIAAGAIPELVFHGEEFDKAIEAGIAPYCDTSVGKLMLYSVKVPAAPIKAALTLDDLQNGTKTATGSTNSLGISGLVFEGATETAPGRRGLVPAPEAGDGESILRGDGTWEKKKAETLMPVSIPSPKGPLEYTGKVQCPEWNNYVVSYMSIGGTTSSTNVGTYYAIFKLRSGYIWEDGSTDDKKVAWTIGKVQAAMPYVKETLTYNKNVQSPEWVNFDRNKMTISGDESATDAGTYSATFTISPNYTWSDGTITPKTVTWTIKRAQVAIPAAVVSSFDHTGEMISPQWKNYDAEVMTMSGEYEASSTGIHTVKFTLKDNYEWTDGTVEVKSVNWWISGEKLLIPSLAEDNLVYNGEVQTPVFNNYDSSKMDAETISATNAGGYYAKFTPKNSYKWEDGTTETKSVYWKIEKASVEMPTVTDLEFTYDGEEHAPVIGSYDADGIKVSGNSPVVGASSNRITFALVSSNYKWSDGTVADKTVVWTIKRAKVPAPTAVNSVFEYTGEKQSPQWNNYDAEVMTMSGEYEASASGTHTVKFALKANYEWTDGTTDDRTITWRINEEKLKVPTLAERELIYNGKVQIPTFNNYDSSKIDAENVSGTNAGNYSAKFTPKGTYRWEDDTTAAKYVSWRIEKAEVNMPTVTNLEFEYDGEEHIPTIGEYDASEITVTGNAPVVNVSINNIIFALASSNYIWSDGTTANKVVTWKITSVKVAIPTLKSTNLVYNGNDQSPEWEGFNKKLMTIKTNAGQSSATNAGTYYTYFELKNNNNCWEDGTTDTKYVSWKISPIILKVPIQKNTDLVYNGNTQYATFNNYNSYYDDKIKAENMSGVNAGTYTAKFTILDGRNYQWEDGSNGAKGVSWKIEAATLDIPSATNLEFIYNGEEFSPEWKNTTQEGMTVTGNLSAVFAGTYTAYFKPASTNYEWPDGTSGQRMVQWRINRAQVKIPVIKDTGFVYNGITQYPEWENFDKKIMAIIEGSYNSGTQSVYSYSSATNAGSYTAYVRITHGSYEWEDGTTELKSALWSIAKAKIEAPKLVGESEFIYTGNSMSPTFENYDTGRIRASNISGTNAGFYNAVFDISNNNYIFKDSTTKKTIPWQIIAATVIVPTATNLEFTYDGKDHSPTWKNIEQAGLMVSGSLSGTNSATYNATFSLSSPTNYMWTDGGTDAKTITWKIKAAKVAVPTTNSVLIYNGKEQSPEWSYDKGKAYISTPNGYVASAINAGTYTIRFYPYANYVWEDTGTRENKDIKWTIDRAKIKVPSISGASVFTYDGTDKIPTFVNYDSEKMSRSLNNLHPIYYGTYTATFAPYSNYVWEDGTTVQKQLSWRINRVEVSLPTAKATTLIWTGMQDRFPEFTYDEERSLIVRGNTQPVEPVGNYGTEFSLKNTNAFEWKDGTIDIKRIAWNVEYKRINGKIAVTPPTLKSMPIPYTGSTQYPFVGNAIPDGLALTGTDNTTSAISAGSYQLSLQPKDGYCWSNNGGTETRTFKWSIG